MTGQEWLRKKAEADIKLTALLAVGALCGALFLLVITFGIAWALSNLFLGWMFSWLPTLAAFAAVGAVFVGNSLAPSRSTSQPLPGTDRAGNARGSNAPPADSMDAILNLLKTVLFVAPRAVNASLELYAKMKRLKGMDTNACAAVIVLLYKNHGSRMTYRELEQKLPGVAWNRVLYELRDVDGVIFHDTDPPGLSLAERLRDELALMTV